MAGEFHPTRFVVGLRMELKLAARAIDATEHSEQVKGHQFDSFETAFVYSCHTNSTRIFESSRLQNRDRFVVRASAVEDKSVAAPHRPQNQKPATVLRIAWFHLVRKAGDSYAVMVIGLESVAGARKVVMPLRAIMPPLGVVEIPEFRVAMGRSNEPST